MVEVEPRMVDVRTLAGVAELSRVLGVGRTTVTQWAARRSASRFPEPVHVLAMGPLYDVDEVTRWYAGYRSQRSGA